MVGIRMLGLGLQDRTIKPLSLLKLIFLVCRNTLLPYLVYGHFHWLSLGALAVPATLSLSKGLQPIHFWVLTVFNRSYLFALPYAINAAYL